MLIKNVKYLFLNSYTVMIYIYLYSVSSQKIKMLSKYLLLSTLSTHQLTIILLIVCGVFFMLILVAFIKMYKLKAQNKKLMETNAFKEEDDSYKDFTNGHLYDDA